MGKMASAQMLAHCAAAMEVSVGDKVLRQISAGKIFGKIAKGHAQRQADRLQYTHRKELHREQMIGI